MRKVIIASLLIFLTVTGYSQNVVFGAKAGVNLSTTTGNDIFNTKFLPSFHVGGLANFSVNENIKVQPEIIYSGKGVKDDAGNYKFNYVNIPVLVQYQSASGFFIETGPQVGFLVSAKRKTSSGNLDFKTSVKSSDYSWIGGVGYKSSLGVGAGARFDFGFFNIAKQGIIRNKTIMISLFYSFGATNEQE